MAAVKVQPPAMDVIRAEWRRRRCKAMAECDFEVPSPPGDMEERVVAWRDAMREEFVRAVVDAFDQRLGEGHVVIVINLHLLPGAGWKFWSEEETLKRMGTVEGAECYEFRGVISTGLSYAVAHWVFRGD